MIIFAEEKHKEQIISLWREAFGDREDEISFYLETLLKYIILFMKKEEVCGMLAILPVAMGDKKGRYIYAVATRKNARGRGISTALLDFAKRYIERNGEKFLVLVPQEESLFEFYKKRGFKSFFCLKKGISTESKKAYLQGSFTKISAEDYFLKRRKFFEQYKLIEWNKDMLEFAKNMYGADLVSVEYGGKEIGIAFCIKIENKLCIKEILSDNVEDMVRLLKTEYSAISVEYVCPDFRGKSYAMIYPEVIDCIYFNIALD